MTGLIKSTLIRQHGRVFYYATTKHPVNYYNVQNYALRRGWRVLQGWQAGPGETTWKIEQLESKFPDHRQWEKELNPKKKVTHEIVASHWSKKIEEENE